MIALVTIGQSPRADVVASMFNEPEHQRLLQFGALDGFSGSDVDRLKPVGTDHPLVTRMADGDEVVVSKRAILPLLQDAVDRAVEEGAEVICVLCTGEFPTLTSRVRLLFPDRILSHTVEAVLPSGTLGVLMPHEGQREMMLRKWSSPDRRVVTAAVSPYATGASFGDTSRSLVDAGAELIVMDCMGFDRRMRAEVREAANVPVLLANGVVGAILGELEASVEPAKVT